jgi:murein DD-endopeptidase MepM/ murein hydrolase activator NlpD
LLKSLVGEARLRLRNWFPDREFFMRSQGQVRFIKLSSRLQLRLAGAVVAMLLVWLATLVGVAIARLSSGAERTALLTREAQVIRAESRVDRYARGINGVADDLQRRQDFIDKIVQAHLGDLPKAPAPGARKIGLAIPEAAPLARIEARQLGFVARLTDYADRRASRDAARMTRLGLNPQMMLASLETGNAEGGPLLPLSTSANGALDPRFARLGQSLARMDALEQGLLRLPQVLPANPHYLSSGFGYRADPFTHAGAFHPGLDFRGPIGSPILAAAHGVVSFAGRKAGYGNCIEIDHGDGLVTRYAHMSAFRARFGEHVAAGQVIGAIGSTGRSTGPHLHFEVRINDRPVNPRPFLEAIAHVSEKSPGFSPSALSPATDD